MSDHLPDRIHAYTEIVGGAERGDDGLYRAAIFVNGEPVWVADGLGDSDRTAAAEESIEKLRAMLGHLASIVVREG